MATSAEQLILRGMHLIMSASFSPNDPEKQATHFVRMQRDIGQWFTDYADEIAKPAVDWTVDFKKAIDEPPDNGSGLQ
jgi:hypothetical protein